ncbi:MAG: hypothetical protein K0R51_3468 [Cytophagaceae bacterium]|jgi:hypothetical protein|nr:hypothetical protein [Cytophagaceae bacterium]
MIIEISDYDGIISLVNAAVYQTFVDEDWELDQLKVHFMEQMNANAILVWQSNNIGGGNWKVEFTSTESNKVAHSEFTAVIEVTNGELYLADYTDLTMAAQYQEYKIPAAQHGHQKTPIENGKYLVKVKRLFNPDEELDEDEIAFEIVLTKTNEINTDPITEVFWGTF